MTAAKESLHLLVGQLRAFAAVTTLSRAGSDELVLQLLLDFEPAETPDRVWIFGELYRRLQLQAGPVTPQSSRARPDAEGDWRNFERLRDGQRSAVFLVIGLEFSIEDAARVLQEPEDWVTLEVMSAMFCLEHVLPAQARPRARSLRRAADRTAVRTRVPAGAMLSRGAVRPPPPARSTAPSAPAAPPADGPRTALPFRSPNA